MAGLDGADAVDRDRGRHICALCCGVIVPEEGTVYHVLERRVVGENPHDGWWRDHPAGPRYLCDACYSEDIHPQFDYGAPRYVPRYQARQRGGGRRSAIGGR